MAVTTPKLLVFLQRSQKVVCMQCHLNHFGTLLARGNCHLNVLSLPKTLTPHPEQHPDDIQTVSPQGSSPY
ncbi:hypothetical protein J3E68DRAFT_419629, partial [Trichoderma sp. SZMC 28012]